MVDDRAVHDAVAGLLATRGMPVDSGVSQRWVRVVFLGIPVWFPNFDARRRILFLHDVHHLLTGYDVTWTGEAEIGAFEIATSCKQFWAAWFFNLGGFLFGLFLAPRRTWRAFVRGRHCTNFYGADDARVRALSVTGARHELGLDRPVPRTTFADAAWFTLWALAVLTLASALPLLVLWLIARAW